MTARKTETPPQMPSEGGSYIRQEDGKLKRVEATKQASAAPDGAPAASKQEA
jgi:hypothetical protein